MLSHTPTEETNPDSNLTLWPWSSLIHFSTMLLYSSPSPWANPPTFITLMTLHATTPKSTRPVQISVPSDSYVQWPCSISETVFPKLSSFFCPPSYFHFPCQLTTICPVAPARKSGHPSLTSLYHTPQSDTKFYYSIIFIFLEFVSFSPSSLTSPSTSPNHHHLPMLGHDHNLQLDSLCSLLLPSGPFTGLIFKNTNLIMSLPSYNPSMTPKCPEKRVQMP